MRKVFFGICQYKQGKLDVLCGIVHICGWLTKVKQIMCMVCSYQFTTTLEYHYSGNQGKRDGGEKI